MNTRQLNVVWVVLMLATAAETRSRLQVQRYSTGVCERTSISAPFKTRARSSSAVPLRKTSVT